MPNGSNGSGDPLVVSSVELRRFLKRELSLRPYDLLNYMAMMLEEDPRNISKKLNYQDFITFGVVDRWLSKLDLQRALSDGTLQVVPNPKWSQERWIRYMVEELGGCE